MIMLFKHILMGNKLRILLYVQSKEGIIAEVTRIQDKTRPSARHFIFGLLVAQSD